MAQVAIQTELTAQRITERLVLSQPRIGKRALGSLNLGSLLTVRNYDSEKQSQSLQTWGTVLELSAASDPRILEAESRKPHGGGCVVALARALLRIAAMASLAKRARQVVKMDNLHLSDAYEVVSLLKDGLITSSELIDVVQASRNMFKILENHYCKYE